VSLCPTQCAACIAALFACALAAGQTPTTQSQPAHPEPSPQQRLDTLLSVVEGPNPPEVRLAIAREILLQRWTETAPRLARVLAGNNVAAQTAVARALAALPQSVDPAYVDPLMKMLADPQADVRVAAAAALAAYRDGGVIPRLKAMVIDPKVALEARLGAVAALGQMTTREAVEGLVEALSLAESRITRAALDALERATAKTFQGDVAAAQAWWQSARTLSLEEWQRLQIERLMRRDRALQRRLEAAESRLAQVLEENFMRASDAERVALLAGYLAESHFTIRLLGLRFTQLHLAEGKPLESLPGDLVGRIRGLLKSEDPAEQAAAVRTVASFRQSEDAATFIALLGDARSRPVRLALINGLGYIGDGPAMQTLLRILEQTEDPCTTEAVAALGRLAERGALSADMRPAVVKALLAVFDRTDVGQVALRERVLWAMGNVGDPAFGRAFATGTDPREALAVRQAAARGIAVLKDPKLADALIGAVTDPDPGIRRMAVETLANLGSSDDHLRALWNRLTSPPEPDEAIQQAAWRGVLRMLAAQEPGELRQWVSALPGDAQNERALALLERVVQRMSESEPIDHARLAVLRTRVAAQHAHLQQHEQAIAAYVAALTDLHASDAAGGAKLSLEIVRYALRVGRYDQRVAAALNGVNPGPDHQALFDAARAEIEPLLDQGRADDALGMLQALEAHPPGAWPPPVMAAIGEVRARAEQLKRPAPASQPESAPATQPGG
jgi:HEAT repeat protein